MAARLTMGSLHVFEQARMSTVRGLRLTVACTQQGARTLRTVYSAFPSHELARRLARASGYCTVRRQVADRRRPGSSKLKQPFSGSPLWRGIKSGPVAGKESSGASRSVSRSAEIRDRNRNYGAWMLALAIGTAGLSYASVPLYRVFCQVTGFGGTVRRAEDGKDDNFLTDMEDVEIVPDRPITVRFNADVSAHVPWRFTPSQSEVVVLPGEAVLAFYVAENMSSKPITGIATYNVAPAKAGLYFNKVQCFCFDEQRLKPGESLDMPVFFYLDPSLAEDEAMADVKEITLSYTFFRAEDVTAEQLQQAQAAAMGFD
jgi:cytochrome c oxidase assembly protein subunit 11